MLEGLPDNPAKWIPNIRYFIGEYQGGQFNFEITCRPKSAILVIESGVNVAGDVVLLHKFGVTLTNFTHALEKKNFRT